MIARATHAKTGARVSTASTPTNVFAAMDGKAASAKLVSTVPPPLSEVRLIYMDLHFVTFQRFRLKRNPQKMGEAHVTEDIA